MTAGAAIAVAKPALTATTAASLDTICNIREGFRRAFLIVIIHYLKKLWENFKYRTKLLEEMGACTAYFDNTKK